MMRIYKNRAFSRWAAKEGLTDTALIGVVRELERGLVDANLGGHVYKQRVAVAGKGKSGGFRTLLVYQNNNKVFFVYGFAKNERANINDDELKALKKYAAELLSYDDTMLMRAVRAGALKEVAGYEKIYS
jgi:hypothetical protein